MDQLELDGHISPDLTASYRPLSRTEMLARGAKAHKGPFAVYKNIDIEEIEVKDRHVTFVSTSGAVDRDNDVIDPDGVKVDHWEKNPIVLFQHDPRVRIGVGTTRRVRNQWVTTATYFSANISPIAEELHAMIQFRKELAEKNGTKDRGAMFSIGFMRLESSFNRERGGIDFDEIEKLEDSDVAIGSNRAALAREAFEAGALTGPLFDWAEQVRKEADIVGINREVGQKLIEAIDPSKGMTLLEMRPSDIERFTIKETVVPDTPEAEPKASDPVAPTEAKAATTGAFIFLGVSYGLDGKKIEELAKAAGLDIGELPDTTTAPVEAKTVETPEAKTTATEFDWDSVTQDQFDELAAEAVASETGHAPDPPAN